MSKYFLLYIRIYMKGTVIFLMLIRTFFCRQYDILLSKYIPVIIGNVTSKYIPVIIGKMTFIEPISIIVDNMYFTDQISYLLE